MKAARADLRERLDTIAIALLDGVEKAGVEPAAKLDVFKVVSAYWVAVNRRKPAEEDLPPGNGTFRDIQNRVKSTG